VIYVKSYTFAVRIVNVYRYLSETFHEYVLSKQLLRSGTAIGALVAEAKHAQSRSDFVNKMNIALKEANETIYWLSLLKDTQYIAQEQYDSLSATAKELLALLISIVKTTKETLPNK
jgi:four helix bundle protein